MMGSNGRQGREMKMVKRGYFGWALGALGVLAVLPVSAADPASPPMRLSAQAIDRDAALAARLGGVLRRVAQADADAPVMRGLHETELFQRTAPAVVLIFALDGNDKPESLGSGSVIDPQGRILTNVHVIEGATRVAVVFKPKSGNVNLGDIRQADLYTATVEKQDRGRDLALLRLERKPDTLVTLPFGSMEGLSVGADVHAIGHPEGATWTYTKGIVSQIRVNAEWSYSDDKSKHHATVIQTQTPINPGNSGGPLINDAMQLVGVNTYSRGDAQGMNYAVSVDDVQRFIAEPARAEAPRIAGKSADGNPPERTAPGKSEPAKPSPGKSAQGPAGQDGKGGGELNEPTPGGPSGGKSDGRQAAPSRSAGACQVHYGNRERAAGQPAWQTELDYNCSGHFNGYVLNWDDPRRGVSLYLDRNGDGKPDAVYEDSNGDGKPELARFDTHQQGRFDVQVELDPRTGEVVKTSAL